MTVSHDEPSVIDGNSIWHDELGMKHRIGAPAYISREGDEYWYIHGELHRENGPAVLLSDGGKYWLLNSRFHRLDGPAIENGDGQRLWYIDNKKIDCNSQEEFEALLKLKAFW